MLEALGLCTVEELRTVAVEEADDALESTMAHHRQKVKMQYSVLGVTNEKTIFFISYSFRQ